MRSRFCPTLLTQKDEKNAARMRATNTHLENNEGPSGVSEGMLMREKTFSANRDGKNKDGNEGRGGRFKKKQQVAFWETVLEETRTGFSGY